MIFRIQQFPLERNETVLRVPPGTLFLKADMYNGVPTVWAAVDLTAPTADVTLVLLSTGEDVVLGCEHIGTFLNGTAPLHLFKANVTTQPKPTEPEYALYYGDDWEAVYKGGKIIACGCSVDAGHLLTALGIKYIHAEAPAQWSDDGFPEDLNDA